MSVYIYKGKCIHNIYVNIMCLFHFRNIQSTQCIIIISYTYSRHTYPLLYLKSPSDSFQNLDNSICLQNDVGRPRLDHWVFIIIWGSSFMFVWRYHFLNNPHIETHVPLQYHVTWNGSEIRRVPVARGSCYIQLCTEFDMVSNIPGCALRVWHAKNVEKHVIFSLICSFHLPQQDAALDLGHPLLPIARYWIHQQKKTYRNR